MNGKQAKKIRREVKKAYPGLYVNLEQAILGLPLKGRLKIAFLIVFRKKMK